MIKANFHTHTTFCDGKNTPEEMVLAAISLGMTAIGFSGHSYSEYETYGMKPDVCAAYQAEILRLKNKYAGQITIFLGIEQDATSDSLDYPYDYVIGSIHGIIKDGQYLCVDYSESAMIRAVEQYYGGDYYAYAEDYYHTLANTVLKHDPTFIGHFDLVTKFNEGGKHFNEAHPRYRKVALDALAHLISAGKPFEINTGAISRGYRTLPYPASFILKKIREMGGRIILSSDAHTTDNLLCGYDKATELAKSCGFTTALILTTDGFQEVPL
ncbi:MAG: histidinol-phosphatase [Lachnospiraceae bacterium]|nr:histidinol-phosphatase [Lachnospiraceae bacterium]